MNRLVRLACAVLAGAAFASLATGAHALDRIGWSKTRETMYIHGDIEVGDAERIVQAIIANKRKLRGVMLNSPGGDVVEGYKLAAMVVGLDFDTSVVKGGECASACFMLWAAGRNRYIHADSRIGIHSASTFNVATGESSETARSYFRTMEMARVYDLLKVPVYLIGQMVVTPPTSMYWLSDTDKQWMQARVLQ
jgi:hypothetical protein